jgi:hypothetical protein
VSNKHSLLRLSAATLIGVGLSCSASAKMYCCTDNAGHRVCGDTMPAQCEDRAYKELGAKGVRSVEAPMTAEQKAQRDAEIARKVEADRLAAERKRKDQALLNTYASEKDIDALRDHAIADIQILVKEVQDKYDRAAKRKTQLDKELEFYAKKPVPATLKSQIAENNVELQAQQKALDDKQKDIEAARAKFEEDRKRFRELTGTAAPGAAAKATDARPR